MIGVMIAQTIISFFFSKGIFAIMLVFTVTVSAIAIYRMLNMQSYIRRTFRTLSESMEASSNMLTKFSVPAMVVSDKGEIIWYNDALRRNMLNGSDLLGQDIGSIMDEKARRSLVEKKQAQVAYGDKIFSVFRSSANYEGVNQAVYFFVDETKLLRTAEEYAAALELGEIHLHVERDNHGARRLYQRRGFGVLAEQGARLLLGKKL